MRRRELGFIVFLLSVALLGSGCGSKISSLLSESWSENYALAVHDAKVSHPELNDGDMKTWGITRPPDRTYTITLPERKVIRRIVIYSGNVVTYKLSCWDAEAGKWELVGTIGSTDRRQRVYSDKYLLNIPRFDHRMDFETDRIKLSVDRAKSDGIVMTRTPAKDDRILNHRIEYSGTGRHRKRIDIYSVYTLGQAAIREIEVYGPAAEPQTEN